MSRIQLACLLFLSALSRVVRAAEVAWLSEANWADFAPVGKEVECIYGDFNLCSDRIVAVIARPGP